MQDFVIPVLPTRQRKETLPNGGVCLAAPAKININLLVGPLRADGFHPIDSIVAKITLYDLITIHPRGDGKITITCRGADCGPVEKNLALRAARLLSEGRKVCGCDIKLEKNIPPGGGLGGGSSDAAVVLIGLNDMWRLEMTAAELAKLAGRLGSDIPLFLGPASLRMTGRGEQVHPVEVHPFYAVLITPGLSCPTAAVYRASDAIPPGKLKQIEDKIFVNPPSQWRTLLINQLAPAAIDVCPELGEIFAAVETAVDIPLHITGSGSTMFMLCDDLAEAQAAVASVPQQYKKMCVIVSSF